MKISDIQIIPIKHKNGIVAIASCILDDSIYLGSIGIMITREGGYRLSYPYLPSRSTEKANRQNIYHPIRKHVSEIFEKMIIGKYEKEFQPQYEVCFEQELAE